jgi:hypothetical protein
MKKISDYRKLLGVNESAGLDELKTVYRTMIKNWHPDRFADDEERHSEAHDKSKSIIEAYHFLVSIAPETLQSTLVDYKNTIEKSTILDFEFKSQVLTVSFYDGSVYEYFDVPKAIYIKLVNADSPGRFARRHIYNSFVYRSTTKIVASA